MTALESRMNGHRGHGTSVRQKRILFICGSMNQTTQMHQISLHLTQYEQTFTPYYCDGIDELYRRLGLMEFTIIGHKLASRCRRYLEDSLGLVTVLAPTIGYNAAAEVAKESVATGRSIRELAVESGLISGDDFDALVLKAAKEGII